MKQPSKGQEHSYGHVIQYSILKRMNKPKNAGTNRGLVVLRLEDGMVVPEEPSAPKRTGGEYGMYESVSSHSNVEDLLGKFETAYGRLIPFVDQGEDFTVEDYRRILGLPMVLKARAPAYMHANTTELLDRLIGTESEQPGQPLERASVSVVRLNFHRGVFGPLYGTSELQLLLRSRIEQDTACLGIGPLRRPLMRADTDVVLGVHPYSYNALLLFYATPSPAAEQGRFFYTEFDASEEVLLSHLSGVVEQGETRLIVPETDSEWYQDRLLDICSGLRPRSLPSKRLEEASRHSVFLVDNSNRLVVQGELNAHETLEAMPGIGRLALAPIDTGGEVLLTETPPKDFLTAIGPMWNWSARLRESKRPWYSVTVSGRRSPISGR